MLFYANFTNLTCSSWICNQMEILQLTKMFDKRHIYVETYNVIPSCIILSLFYHLLKIHILAVYQFCWLFKIATSSQLTSTGLSGRAWPSSAPACFSNPHVKLELFTKFLQNFDTKVCLDNCPLDKRLLGQLVPWTLVPWTIVATPKMSLRP